MHCGQDVPWTASTKDGRLACSRCGQTPADGPDLPPTGHIPLNIPINDLHGAHTVGSSSHATNGSPDVEPEVSVSGDPLDPGTWPVSSAYDGWSLDEQLTHIREVLDSLSDVGPSEVRRDAAAVKAVDADPGFEDELPKIEHRIDAMHRGQRGLHRRRKKRGSLAGRFLFGLIFFVLGTGTLVLSVASIIPRQIWLPGDLPIAGVLLQVLGVFLVVLGLSALLRRFQEAVRLQEVNKRHRRFDEPQREHHSPHVNAKGMALGRQGYLSPKKDSGSL